MKSILNTFLLLVLPFALFAAEDTDDFFKLGGKNTNDKLFEFEMDAGTANPKIKAESDGTLSFSTDGTNFSHFGSGDGGGAINLISNPGYEQDLSDWTDTGSATFSVDTDAADVYLGAKSALWDAAAASDTLASEAVSIPGGLRGNLCSVEVQYKGGDDNIALQAYDGTDVLATVDLEASANNFTKAQVAFTCPDSGTIQGRLFASADAAAINVDQWVVGKSADLINALAETEWQDFDPAFTNFTNHQVLNARYKHLGKTTVLYEINGDMTGSGAGGAINYTLPVPHANLANSTDFIAVGYMTYQPQPFSPGNRVANCGLTTDLETVRCRKHDENVRGDDFDPSGEWGMTGIYEIDASSAPASLNPIQKVETSAWHISGKFDNAFAIGIGDDTLFQLASSGSGVISTDPGSLETKILCDNASPEVGSCTGVDELMGFSFTPPKAGQVFVCFQGNNNMDDTDSHKTLQRFKIVRVDPENVQEGAENTAYTPIAERGELFNRFHVSDGEDWALPIGTCGIFDVPASEVGFILAETTDIQIGAPETNFADQLTFTVIPITQQLPQAILLDLPQIDYGTTKGVNGAATGSNFIREHSNEVSTSTNSYTTLATASTPPAGLWVFTMSAGVTGAAGKIQISIGSDDFNASGGFANDTPGLFRTFLYELDGSTDVVFQYGRNDSGGSTDIRNLEFVGYRIR